jgi:hypothetical protein
MVAALSAAVEVAIAGQPVNERMVKAPRRKAQRTKA